MRNCKKLFGWRDHWHGWLDVDTRRFALSVEIQTKPDKVTLELKLLCFCLNVGWWRYYV